jgi:hypothetical protein
MTDTVMLDRVKNLAQLMRDKKSAGDKFALMLGAGASLSSGVIPTKQIMQEIVERYAHDYHDGSIEERFGDLWRRSTSSDRKLFLEQYLKCMPSDGYGRLADLTRMGYFDVIVTFNFDRLLETAFDEAGFKQVKDYRTVIRGETDINAFTKLVRIDNPKVKIVKLHGSLDSAEYFLFSEEEMANYPPEIANLLGEITHRDIIICGYAFEDLCVARAFDTSPDAGSIYYVNPAGAGGQIRGILIGRRSKEKVISGDLGRFDDFFTLLQQELAGPREPIPAGPKGQNPFKFMDSYREADKEWFFGRKDLSDTMLRKIETQDAKVLCVQGLAKIGKTSFIRAGLMAQLDRDKYECIYLSCKREVESQLLRELEKRFALSIDGKDLDSVLQEAKQKTPKRILIFFDHFERVVHACSGDGEDNTTAVTFLATLTRNSDSRLTPVFITLKEEAFFGLLLSDNLKRELGKWEFEYMERLDEKTLGAVIQQLASKAGTGLAPQTVDRLCKTYRENPKFTLTHVQTLCYYHVNGFDQDCGDYDSLPNPGLLAALDSVTDDSNLMNLIDELSPEDRALIRSVMKVICHPAAKIKWVVEFMKRNFSNLTGKETYPEPVSVVWPAKMLDRD